MKKIRVAPLLLTAVYAFSIAGCDRKNNPLMSSPSAGVTSASLFVPQIDTTAKGDVNRIFVTAFDGVGAHLTNFQLGNFSILEGGSPGIPFEVGRVTDPLYVVITIDRSGSMGGFKEAAADTAAINLVNALGVTDFAALVEFSNTVAVTVPFTNDKAALNAAIAAGVSLGGTAIYDACDASVGLLNGVKGRRMLVLLTDGEDNSSRETLGGSISGVNKAGLSCYTVGLGVTGIDFDDAILGQMATETGGSFNSSADGSTLTTIFLSILDRFQQLTYIRYRRRAKGDIKVYLNYGTLTANAEKKLD